MTPLTAPPRPRSAFLPTRSGWFVGFVLIWGWWAGCFPSCASELPTLARVDFSLESQLFTNSLSVTLAQKNGAAIYFTRNGAVPNNLTGTLYTNPIALTDSTEIRAVAYLADWNPSPLASESFIKIGPDLAAFTSPLPIVILHNGGAGSVPGISSRGPNGDGSDVVEVPPQRQALIVLNRDDEGKTRLTNKVSTASRAGVRIRGSSSFNNSKKSYHLEIWDAANEEREVSLLGLPAESEWALYGPSWRNPTTGSDYDAALIHNSFIYELANASGYYAPRTRFVELFLNTGGGAVTLSHYAGLFILMETVKRDGGRVDFEPLATNGLTGGWMLSIDRMDSLPPGSTVGSLVPRHFHTAGPDRVLQTPDDNPRGYKGIRYTLAGGAITDVAGIDPIRDDMPNYYFSSFNFESPRGWTILPAQRQAITGFMSQFDAALYGPNYTDPATGYAAFIDVENWAHHFILQNFPKNQDAEVLSTYLVRKSSSARLQHGPIWDFDRAYNQSPTSPNPSLNLDWTKERLFYLRLFSAPDFQQAYIDKWQQLRRGAFADTNLLAIVDRQTNEITSAVPAREGMVNWATRIGSFKQWLTNRAAALDGQFLKMPNFSQDGGAVSNGYALTLSNPNPSGTIFFTLNGVDPRAPGGAVAPAAVAWPQSLIVNGTTVARARVKNGATWSGLAEAVFYPPQELGTLALTEIMYHPPDVGFTNGEAFEFLELKNTGTNTLNLTGLRFSDGLTFNFTNGTLLAPGAFFVLVSDPAAFLTKYPGVTPNGTFSSGHLNNGGESITLRTALGSSVFSVAFGDRAPWPIAPDGYDFSLVQKFPGQAQAPDDGAKWRASSLPGGSPGADDPPPDIPPVLLNEVLTASEPPAVDFIELFNPTESAVNLGGWFLTDDPAWPRKFRIPAGLLIPKGGFLVFSETDFNRPSGPNQPFSLNSAGDQAYLFSADADGRLTGYSHGFAFAAAARGVSFGRHVSSVGEEQFPAQTVASPSEPNGGPRVGPVVLSEIMYHPPSNGVEFVEFANVSDSPVSLFDSEIPPRPWRLNGADFVFPTNAVLPARGVALVVATNPAAFRALHPLPASVLVFGPFEGSLQNSGERLELTKPGEMDTNGAMAFIVVDAVRYHDAAPWPAAADGAGWSLHRLALEGYGDDPTNWVASAPAPGRFLDQDGDAMPDWWERANGFDPLLDDAALDADNDGSNNYSEYLSGTDPRNDASALRLNAELLGDFLKLSFTAAPGRAYTLRWREGLAEGSWTDVAAWAAAPGKRTIEWTYHRSSAAGFYRLFVSRDGP